ncbi:MAG: chromosomal replication initiator protein DnaA [Myxococcota bacterium]|jgi:chromosomal replication initiator protein|nr:chromosomal replication initiator protein DnaA [Myxococcota bacterium]
MLKQQIDIHTLWANFLSVARTKVSAHVWQTWFKPIQPREIVDGTLILAVRDQFFRDWLSDHYLDFIRDHLNDIAGENLALDWSLDPTIKAAMVDSNEDMAGETEVLLENTQEVVFNPRTQALYSKQFNPRYTFDTFIAGPSNQLAFAGSKAVAENPASSYNPLFLFGGVGLGKTHLISAIGQQILQDRPGARVIYTSAEQFVNEVIAAVRFSKLEEFHAKYRRNCDVILIDDIQLIAGKVRTQHEFFHVFNTLYDSQRQIVVTSDKLPHEIPDIEERLRSRFQWGLIADIQPPELETRVAILQKKAENDKIDLPDEVLHFLASSIRSNVRELEGALVRIAAHSSLTGSAIDINYARNVLTDILSTRPAQISIESIQKTVAGYYQVKMGDLKSASRQKVIVRPRQVAMYLCRKHAGASYPELGIKFGNKDHTTILSAFKKIGSLLKEDPTLRSEVFALERKLDLTNLV